MNFIKLHNFHTKNVPLESEGYKHLTFAYSSQVTVKFVGRSYAIQMIKSPLFDFELNVFILVNMLNLQLRFRKVGCR